MAKKKQLDESTSAGALTQRSMAEQRQALKNLEKTHKDAMKDLQRERSSHKKRKLDKMTPTPPKNNESESAKNPVEHKARTPRLKMVTNDPPGERNAPSDARGCVGVGER